MLQTKLVNTFMISPQELLGAKMSPCLLISKREETVAMDLVKLVACSPLMLSLVTSLGVPLSWLGKLEIFLPQFKLNTMRELASIFTQGRTSKLVSEEEVNELNGLISALGLEEIHNLFENVSEDEVEIEYQNIIHSGDDIKTLNDDSVEESDDSIEYEANEDDQASACTVLCHQDDISHDESVEISSCDGIMEHEAYHDDISDDIHDVMLEDNNNNNLLKWTKSTKTTFSSKKLCVKKPSLLFDMERRSQQQPPPIHSTKKTKECQVTLKKLSYNIMVNSMHNHTGLRSSACNKCSNCLSNLVLGNCRKCKFCLDMSGPKKLKQKCKIKEKYLASWYPACPHCRNLFRTTIFPNLLN